MVIFGAWQNKRGFTQKVINQEIKKQKSVKKISGRKFSPWLLNYIDRIEKLAEQKLRQRGIGPEKVIENESSFDFENSRIMKVVEEIEKITKKKRTGYLNKKF